MEAIIKCYTKEKGIHKFYIEYGGKRYFLFSQDYRRGVNNYFCKGVSLHNALCIKTAKRNHAVIKTMSKLKIYIRYIEKEYGLKILKKTLSYDTYNDNKKNLFKFDEYFAYN